MIYYLALILALLPTYLIRFRIGPLPTTLLEILIVGFLLVSVLKFEKKDWLKIKKLGKINYAIGLFVLAGLISIFVSPEKTAALGQFKAFILEPALMFYAILITIRKPEQLQIVCRWLFISAVLISAFGLFQYVSLIHLPLRFWGNGTEVERITSIFEYPNALSLFLGPLIGFFTALWLADYPMIKNKWAWLAGELIMALALLLTFSRGAWIATTIGLLVIISKRFGFKKTAFPIIILGLSLLLIPSVRQRLSIGVSDPSSSAHWNLMKIAWQQIVHNPLFGNGLHGFVGQDVLYPHNIILNFWTELGLLGLVSFIWIIILAYRQFMKKPQAIYFAAAVYLLILLIHGLIDVPYFKNDLSVLFWFVISIFYL